MVGRVIALLFHDRGTRREWVVSSTPRPHFTPGKEPVPILQGARWAPGPVWTDGKSRPHRDSIPDRPVLSQSLYRLSYLAHNIPHTMEQKCSTVLHLLYWYTIRISVLLIEWLCYLLFNVEYFIFKNLTQHNYMILKILWLNKNKSSGSN